MASSILEAVEKAVHQAANDGASIPAALLQPVVTQTELRNDTNTIFGRLEDTRAIPRAFGKIAFGLDDAVFVEKGGYPRPFLLIGQPVGGIPVSVRLFGNSLKAALKRGGEVTATVQVFEEVYATGFRHIVFEAEIVTGKADCELFVCSRKGMTEASDGVLIPLTNLAIASRPRPKKTAKKKTAAKKKPAA